MWLLRVLFRKGWYEEMGLKFSIYVCIQNLNWSWTWTVVNKLSNHCFVLFLLYCASRKSSHTLYFIHPPCFFALLLIVLFFVQVICCPKWRRRWAHQRDLCLIWVSSATAATGRKCYSDTCTTFKAKKSLSKVHENKILTAIQKMWNLRMWFRLEMVKVFFFF